MAEPIEGRGAGSGEGEKPGGPEAAPEGGAKPAARPGLERLELRVERLRITFRFTFAFHAREVRFERDAGDGFERIFPETFSFHASRHDPTEFFLQLDDLMRKPRLVAPRFSRRDATELVTRLLAQAPHYLERVGARLEAEGRLDGPAGVRVRQDTALLAQLLLRFIETRELAQQRSLRVASFLLRKLAYRSLMALCEARVDPEFLEAYVRGEAEVVDARDDPSESGFFHVLEAGDQDVVNRMIVRATERAFYLWLEGVCLDEENHAFEKEDSPFADRESEVMAAITTRPVQRIQTCEDLSPFLRRSSRDCRRVLQQLETWFLHQYDIPNSSAMIHHAADVGRGTSHKRRSLSWHTPRIHVVMLLAMAAPFMAGALFYPRAPLVFDVLCGAEVAVIYAAFAWFLGYRFCWKRDLSFFHASVPRIGAGIIVGYLPVFLIDEVWDLARQPVLLMAGLVSLLGLATLLYVYVEVQRRLDDPQKAFARARGLFVLGVVQALGIGVVMTSLIGPFMVQRNWSPGMGVADMDALRAGLLPWLGELPQVIGQAPLYVFPSAILLMTFLSFFIGIFLQLMWEDIAITEPL